MILIRLNVVLDLKRKVAILNIRFTRMSLFQICIGSTAWNNETAYFETRAESDPHETFIYNDSNHSINGMRYFLF